VLLPTFDCAAVCGWGTIVHIKSTNMFISISSICVKKRDTDKYTLIFSR
jgi:hypothetical protein